MNNCTLMPFHEIINKYISWKSLNRFFISDKFFLHTKSGKQIERACHTNTHTHTSPQVTTTTAIFLQHQSTSAQHWIWEMAARPNSTKPNRRNSVQVHVCVFACPLINQSRFEKWRLANTGKLQHWTTWQQCWESGRGGGACSESNAQQQTHSYTVTQFVLMHLQCNFCCCCWSRIEKWWQNEESESESANKNVHTQSLPHIKPTDCLFGSVRFGSARFGSVQKPRDAKAAFTQPQ